MPKRSQTGKGGDFWSGRSVHRCSGVHDINGTAYINGTASHQTRNVLPSAGRLFRSCIGIPMNDWFRFRRHLEVTCSACSYFVYYRFFIVAMEQGAESAPQAKAVTVPSATGQTEIGYFTLSWRRWRNASASSASCPASVWPTRCCTSSSSSRHHLRRRLPRRRARRGSRCGAGDSGNRDADRLAAGRRRWSPRSCPRWRSSARWFPCTGCCSNVPSTCWGTR